MYESSYKKYKSAYDKAHERYMDNFVEVKIRMTPEDKANLQAHLLLQKENGITSESMSAFINRAIVETIERDIICRNITMNKEIKQ